MWKIVVGAVLGFLFFALGVWGWLLTGRDFLDALYGAIALFALDFPGVAGAIPVPLQIARFGAFVTIVWAAAWSATWVVVELLGRSRTKRKARKLERPILLLGSGREVRRLAAGLRAHHRQPALVVVGNSGLPTNASKEGLDRTIVLHREESQDCLTDLIRNASTIFVAGETDAESLALAREVNRKTEPPRFPTRVLFDSPDVTTLWNDGDDDRRGGVSRSSVVAAHLLRHSPVQREGFVSPPPMIIGEGTVAAEVLRGMVRGWQQPGEVLRVHALGDDRSWFDDTLIALQSRVAATWTDTRNSSAAVAKEVRRLIELWTPPRSDKYEPDGPLIVVTHADDTITVPVAERLAHSEPAARITAVVDRADDWSGVADRLPNLTLVGVHDLLVDVTTLLRTRTDALCDEIVAELGRWPADRVSVVPVTRQAADAPARFADQEDATQRTVRAIAENIVAILEEGEIVVGRARTLDPLPIFCNPDQLSRMAAEVTGHLTAPTTVDDEGTLDDPVQERRVRTLEFAARLPILAARAGFTPHRPEGMTDDLNTGQLQKLAMGAHASYLATAEETKNATESENWRKAWADLDTVEQHSNLAQIFDAPVKLATVDRTWRQSMSPVLHHFTDDEVEFLAEMEHRRWHHFQVRNGRPHHRWGQPWADLPDGTKEYDRDAVRSLPRMLAAVGLEIITAP